MTGNNMQKVGRLMVKNGIYKGKDGKEKNRYHEIGILLATPHHSQMCIKLHANGFGEGQFVSVFYDDGKQPNFADKEPISVSEAEEIPPEEIPPEEIPPEEIPF